jgi:hypothetical protein
MNSKSKELGQVHKDATPYDQELRAVGQGLESLGITDFDLEVEGDGYFVLGKATQSSQEKAGDAIRKRRLRNKLRGAWQSVTVRLPMNGTGPKIASGSTLLRVLFTPEGIDRLQQEGREKRRADSPGISNPDRLSQVLRMVGEYLNRRSGKLFKICKRKDCIAFEYETALEPRALEKWKISDLYDFWLQLPNQRKNRYEIAERVLAAESEKTHI